MKTLFILLVGVIACGSIVGYRAFVYDPDETVRLRAAYVKQCVASATYYNRQNEDIARGQCESEANIIYPSDSRFAS